MAEVMWVDVRGSGVQVPDGLDVDLVRCDDLDAAAQAAKSHAGQAVVVALAADAIAQRPITVAWQDVLRDVPVLLVGGGTDHAVLRRWVEAGVQDVLEPHEATSPATARRIAMAIARKQRERDARRAWSTDLQTGLPHRAQLLEHLSELLALRARQPAVMALLAVVIDGIDAAAGAAHDAEATQVLRRKIAVRLRGAVRASDVVASLGDDAFALLLAKIEAADDAQRVAAKLVRMLREPFRVLGASVGVRAHVGSAVTPRDGDDPHALLENALQAAQLAQRAGQPAANG